MKGGHKNIVEALLKKHVDIDLPGKEKKTPVYNAVEKGHLAILKLLLASNPDLEHTTVVSTLYFKGFPYLCGENKNYLIHKKDRRGRPC